MRTFRKRRASTPGSDRPLAVTPRPSEYEMETTENGWTILDRNAGILQRQYKFSGAGRANCWVSRFGDDQLLVVSPAKDLDDSAFADLNAFGKVAAVVAPNGFHYLGQPQWKERFGDARFFAPPAAVERISNKSKVTMPEFEDIAGLSELLGDDVGVRPAPHTKCGEAWAWARTSDGGFAWYGSDVFNNMPEFRGPWLFKLAMKLTGSIPGYKMFNLAMLATMKRKKDNMRVLLEDVQAHPPTIMTPGHGPTLSQNGLAGETEALVQGTL